MSTGINVFTVEILEAEVAAVDEQCCFQHGFGGDDHDSHVFVIVSVLCERLVCKLIDVDFMTTKS